MFSVAYKKSLKTVSVKNVIHDLHNIPGKGVLKSMKMVLKFGKKIQNEDSVRNMHVFQFLGDNSKSFPWLLNLLLHKFCRLAITRALYRNSSILILDEATSALDSRSELLVRQALEQLMKNHTVLVIAHRLETVLMANRVFLLDDGKLKELPRESIKSPSSLRKARFFETESFHASHGSFEFRKSYEHEEDPYRVYGED